LHPNACICFSWPDGARRSDRSANQAMPRGRRGRRCMGGDRASDHPAARKLAVARVLAD
jgi:hypothetical protein